MAAWHVVRFALELGLTEVEFEGYSRDIADALNVINYLQGAFGVIIEDTKTLTQNLHIHFFLHVKRTRNTVAYTLARRAQHCSALNARMELVPPNVEHLLSLDISFLMKFTYLFLKKKKKKKSHDSGPFEWLKV